jgi:DNA (cytosine-5)-methyltransferase 1
VSAYYNEIDPYAAQWLRNLIAAGHIADGEVDERSIVDVQHEELRGFDQCHFFAGIGVWSHALRRAGWPDDHPIWTGSCPCQPFSAAGKQKGFDDERHLWPVWFRLIDQCRPPVVLGEQVASALDWVDLVSADMESAGYAVGASDLCAAGFGGAHIRQRLYFVGVADAAHEQHDWAGFRGARGWAEYPDGRPTRSMADADDEGPQGHGQSGRVDVSAGRETSGRHGAESGVDGNAAAPMLGRNPVDWLFCRDGKWRPVEPGTFPLADAAPARVGRLRAYGNGLDAETATQFIEAVTQCLP